VKHLRSLVFVTLTSIALCSGTISAQAADATPVGSIGIRIAQILAADSDNPFAPAYIVSRLQPGTAHTQRLEIFNTSTQEMKVDLYPGLATFDNKKFLIGNGRDGNNFTSWIKLLPGTLTLKPNEAKSFNMTITPPVDAASIQQFGVIWAEVQGEQNAAGITSVSRVGIRIYVPIGNAPDISISEINAVSTTNEIILKKSFISTYLIQLIVSLVFLLVILSIFFFFLLRRSNSDRKYRKENEKQLEAQWKRERDRRRKVWKSGGQSPRNDPRNDPHEDDY
jgi:hypothetical protein